MSEPTFLKGHGTGNDFVLLPDPDAVLHLTPERVRALCDRRFGIGADGVLRVVPTPATAAEAEAAALDPAIAAEAAARSAAWFMDYRNADGSVSEMCGNGLRVFARHLVQAGLEQPGRFAVATRGGVLDVEVPHATEGDVSAAMGTATTPMLRVLPQVVVGERQWPATGVVCPNPHAVVWVDDLADAGDLREAPTVVPPAVFPDGVNVEFAVRVAPGHVRMRVHERGVGETLSCGTGAVAVAWALRRQDGADGPGPIRVDVPGGTVHVAEDADGALTLIGPAVIVATGTVRAELWGTTA